MAGGDWLRLSRGVPTVSWSAPTRWRPRPLAVVALWAGLWVFGTGDALLIRAGVGNTPWTILAQGISARTGWSIGVLTILIGAVVLLLWIPLGERPGLGTLSNIVLIGVAIDVMAPHLPQPEGTTPRIAQAALGVCTIGLGGALYLSTHLGPGPRDGWMTGLHRVTGIPIFWVRLGIEVVVLVTGIAFGGTFGIGTILFAFGIGHVLALWLNALGQVDHRVAGAAT